MEIDDTTLKTIVAKAVFDGISAEQRQDLLQKAIASLLVTPPKPSSIYDRSPPSSPLMSIFEMEVQNLARETVREEFKKNAELKSTMSGLVAKVVSALAENSEVAVEMAAAIAKALARSNNRD
jgi:hypothetical protein